LLKNIKGAAITKQKLSGKAQGLVEFALIIPMLMFVLLSVFEVGRALFLIAVVHTTSREAARYGTASGEISSSIVRYQDCDGIRAAGMRLGSLAGITPQDITISYDTGTISSTFATCPIGGVGPSDMASGDRIRIEVNASISPIIPVSGFSTIPVSASTSRTILSDISILGTPPAPGTEPQPNLYITKSDSPIVPEGDSLIIEVRLSYAIDKDVTFTVSTMGTASSADYQLSPIGTVTISAGGIRTFLTFQATADLINDEPLEDLTVILNNPTNALLGTPSSYTIRISDVYIPPTVSFVTDHLEVPENGKTGVIIVQLSHPTSRDITIPLSVSGTATRGLTEDYTIVPLSSLWIQAGYKYASIVVNIYDDVIDEYDETVKVTLGTPSNAVLVSPSVHTLTILDDDDPPNVHFTVDSQSFLESVGTVNFTAQLSLQSGKVITVPLSFAGTATGGGVDYLYNSGSFVFQPGQTQISKSVQIINDLIDEYDETVDISMGMPVNAVPDQPDNQTLTIMDDDSPPDVNFGASNRTVSEGVFAIYVGVSLNYESGKAVVIRFISSGTATDGVDYSMPTTQITIQPGEMSGGIWLFVNDDSLYEGNEIVNVTIDSIQHGDIVTPSTQAITIEDNESPPLVRFSIANLEVGEQQGRVNISLSLSQVSAQDVRISIATSGTATEGEDYVIETKQITISAGSTTTNLPLMIIDDSLIEGNESLVLSFASISNATAGDPDSVSITIIETDPYPAIPDS
jgi:hypothetical protein